MKIIYSIFLGLMIPLVSCSESTDGSSFRRSLVDIYILSDDLEGGSMNSQLKITLTGPRIYNSQQNSELYNELCEKFGDLSFNRSRPPGSPAVIGDEFDALDITSDKDFDDDHPAGTSLADIAVLHAKTVYPFILSGYDKSLSEWTSYSKKLSELKADDLKLIDPSITVEFTVRPPEPEHTLTVTFSGPEKTISKEVEVKLW